MQVPGSSKSATSESTIGVPVFPTGQMLLFGLVSVLFLVWGMSNNLTDILVQQFKKSFELSIFSAQLVGTANFLGYFFMAIPAALVMRRWGYKSGMLMGLILLGTGMVLFWPAAVSGKYAPFLVALFAGGCGCAVLETAANPFMAQFGPAPTSERRLNFAQSFNPPGTILGVWLGRTFIFSGVELTASQVDAQKAAGTYHAYLHGEIMRVVPTYVAIGSTVLLFALILSRMKFPKMAAEHEDQPEGHGSFAALRHYPQLWFAVAANFLNVGAQISVWQNQIFYMKRYTSVSEKHAADYLIYTLIALMLGRFFTVPIMKHIAPAKLLGIYGAINVLLMAVAITQPGMIGGWGIVASTFFLSIMFPTIFALGLKGLGENTKLGGSLLVMAVVGGALCPPIVGYIATRTGSIAHGYIVPLICFAGVSLYGFCAPFILPPPGNTDPGAGQLAAERGYGI
ncbi:MAG TPA: L-fucose:H+ symporter permease [Acidobacteriaceae bacterium]|nr:L-fucose:H+ symporter permease [Acidobacteriaceae bacterium]